MRVKFPEGSGGPFVVPGVGPVNEGEPFDWPDDQPPVAGTVPADDPGGGDAEAGAPAPQDEPGDRPRAKGSRR